MKSNSLWLVCLVMLPGLTACLPAAEKGNGSEPLAVPTERPTLPPAELQTELTGETLRNMAYRGIYDDPVTLTAGIYEGEPFVKGGASRPTVTLLPFIALGDLNGDGANDAALLLVENSGGSGSFVYLAVVISDEGEPENKTTLLLGDRLSPESINVIRGEIVVEAVTHAADDPLCCPSLRTRTTYALQNGELSPVRSETLPN